MLLFTPLDHPATPQEVRDGQALFSLDAPGAARVVKLPHYPMPARWITDKRFPQKNYSRDPVTGQPDGKVWYDQAGLVWQAEEMQVNGKWQRYYGFIGRNFLGKLPAEEIELPGGWEWQAFSPGLEGKIDIIGRDGKQGPFTPDEPMTITISLRNSRGMEHMEFAGLSDPALACTVVLLRQNQRGDDTTELAKLPGSAFPPPPAPLYRRRWRRVKSSPWQPSPSPASVTSWTPAITSSSCAPPEVRSKGRYVVTLR